MNNQQIIIKLLDTDQDMYNDLIFHCFISWCALQCVFNIPFKVLVNNESLYNWYYKSWQIYVEDAFVEDHKKYIEAVDNNTAIFFDLFKTYQPEVENYYPRVILNMIKQSLTKKEKNV